MNANELTPEERMDAAALALHVEKEYGQVLRLALYLRRALRNIEVLERIVKEKDSTIKVLREELRQKESE